MAIVSGISRDRLTPKPRAACLVGAAVRCGHGEAIWLFGLLARARLHTGASEAAEAAARLALAHSRASSVFAAYSLEGYAGSAEALPARWAAGRAPPGAPQRRATRDALRGGADLRALPRPAVRESTR